MQTIGERFEDMRKRKGVSLREAAEATKIRGDYLGKFESNQFDIGLSDIYVRGFLRSYALFLKLPPDRILNDYESLGHNSDTRPRQPSREVYGRMDVSVSTAEERAERPAGSAGDSPAAETSAPAAHSPRHRGAPMASPSINPALVFTSLKWLGVIIAVLLVVWIGKAIFGGSSAEHAAASAPQSAVAAAPEPEAPVTVIATDPVRVKVVRQSNGEELYQGQMEKGERREFPNVPLWVTATALESVRLEFKGKQYKMQKSGYDRVPIDASQFPH